MKDKVCIITGANSGIGKITALELAKKNAKVIMICRNKEKGENAYKEIIEKSENRNTELMICDLSSKNDIRKLTGVLTEKFPKIDVLVNNAGAINDARTVTVDGYETTFATNHLGYFLLTDLLLKNLKAVPKARIVNVASEAQRAGKLFFDDLNLEKGYSSMKAYCQSKLANIIFTYELARRLEGSKITANCLHPGTVRTNFGTEITGFFGFLFKLSAPFLRTVEKGAETVVWLASSSEVDGITGKYFCDKKEIKSQSLSYDLETAKHLWEISEKMVN